MKGSGSFGGIPIFGGIFDTLLNTLHHLTSWNDKPGFGSIPPFAQNIPRYAQQIPQQISGVGDILKSFGSIGETLNHLMAWQGEGNGGGSQSPPARPPEPPASRPPEPQVIVPPSAGGYYPYKRY